MAGRRLQFFIVTGEPGVGKTTLVKKIIHLLEDLNVKTIGFYTEEVRQNRTREGFDVVSLDGQRGRLARDMNSLDTPAKYKVGKYGVLIQEFEKIAMPCLDCKVNGTQLLVIDEIGKMELFSVCFKNKIKELVDSTNNIILATIPVRKADAIIESLRHSPRSRIWMVTQDNREYIYEDIIDAIKTVLLF